MISCAGYWVFVHFLQIHRILPFLYITIYEIKVEKNFFKRIFYKLIIQFFNKVKKKIEVEILKKTEISLKF